MRIWVWGPRNSRGGLYRCQQVFDAVGNHYNATTARGATENWTFIMSFMLPGERDDPEIHLSIEP